MEEALGASEAEKEGEGEGEALGATEAVEGGEGVGAREALSQVLKLLEEEAEVEGEMLDMGSSLGWPVA